MNWLDIVLLILVGGSVVSAFLKGFSRELVGFVAVIAALVLSAWFYGTVSGYLLPYLSSRAVANFVGFIVVFCAVLALGGLVGRLLKSLMKVAGLSFLDRLLGAAFGFARGFLVAVALLVAIMSFAPDRKVPRAVVESRLAPYVMDAARACASMAPYELREGFRNSYEEVRTIWRGSLRKGSRLLPRNDKERNEREI